MTLSSVNNLPLRIFDEKAVAFLGDLSSRLMKSSAARQHPDIMAFAFFIRPANIKKLQEAYSGDGERLGRGTCFHIAPANIPINFAFSWVFSLLAGNANIVRLPTKDFPQVSAFLEVADSVLAKYPEIAERNAFVKYPRTDNDATAAYSLMADCRMIWGGDRTIAAIRSLPTNPRCVDIAFADRYSVAMINGDAVLSADDVAMSRLAQDFYNDTYLMDQNACSSPQLILWENDSPEARLRFWDAVYAFAERKYALQDAVAVDKYAQFCEEAARNESIASMSRRGNLLYCVELKEIALDVVLHRGKAGFFFEHSLRDRAELFKIITEKFQTVTQFGVNAAELASEIAIAGLRGIDRIVSIGKAMDIGVVWDGHDLIRELSRIIAFV